MQIFRTIKIVMFVGIALVLSVFLLRPLIRHEALKNHWIKYPSIIPTKDWKRFTSDEGKFSVWFPGVPDLTNDVISVSNVSVSQPCYFVWNRQNEYAVIYSDLPKNLERFKPEQKFDISQKAVGAKLGKIVYQKNIEFANYPGRDFEYAVDGKIKYSGRVRLILVGDRLYGLIVIFWTGDPHTADRDTFLSSFRLHN
jgi:hypothetical protein